MEDLVRFLNTVLKELEKTLSPTALNTGQILTNTHASAKLRLHSAHNGIGLQILINSRKAPLGKKKEFLKMQNHLLLLVLPPISLRPNLNLPQKLERHATSTDLVLRATLSAWEKLNLLGLLNQLNKFVQRLQTNRCIEPKIDFKIFANALQ